MTGAPEGKAMTEPADADGLMAPYRALEEHLPQRTKRVLETLLRLHRANESLCLSFDAIATAAGVPRGTAVGAIEKLADLGVVTIHSRRYRRGRRGPDCNTYEINPPPLSGPPKRKRSVERAAAAIAENPARSNCAIAATIGVSRSTVAEARKAAGAKTIERIGRDGRLYSAARWCLRP
jgi:DNA-binding Lrp family transcriptional regulator